MIYQKLKLANINYRNKLIHVIILTETCIEKGLEQTYQLLGFTAYHITREDGYGGLPVFIRDDMPHSYYLEQSNADIYFIALKISFIRDEILATYRPPRPKNNVKFLSNLDGFLESTSICIRTGPGDIFCQYIYIHFLVAVRLNETVTDSQFSVTFCKVKLWNFQSGSYLKLTLKKHSMFIEEEMQQDNSK